MTVPVPSRRDVLTGNVSDRPAAEIHVSSLVLHIRPESLPEARAALAMLPGVEVHAESGGKVVVTLETESEADIVTRMNAISFLPGVLSTALVFHQVETEPAPTTVSDQG
jgi:periplasmic nitrate reductase NapD